MDDDAQQLPWCRATIARGTITLNHWAPFLIRGGPAAMALEWREETPEFWQHVRRVGAFPGFCPACGGSLPEWKVLAESEGGVPRRARSLRPAV